jgi:hypothetical protein
MIRLDNVVGRYLLRCRLHGSKVIAHPRKTGKRCGWRCGWRGMGEFEFFFYNFWQFAKHREQMPAIEAEVIEFFAVGKTAVGCKLFALRGTQLPGNRTFGRIIGHRHVNQTFASLG